MFKFEGGMVNMTLQLSNIKFKENNTWNSLLNMIFPTGYCYISLTNEEPSQIYGGTWVKRETTRATVPYFLTNSTTPGTWVNDSSTSYATRTFTPVFTDAGISLGVTKLGHPGLTVTVGNGTMTHYHSCSSFAASPTDGSAQRRAMRGADSAVRTSFRVAGSTYYAWTTLTAASGAITAYNSTGATSYNHNHTITSGNWKTSTAYSGTHTHTFTGTAKQFNATPYWQLVHMWVKTN